MNTSGSGPGGCDGPALGTKSWSYPSRTPMCPATRDATGKELWVGSAEFVTERGALAGATTTGHCCLGAYDSAAHESSRKRPRAYHAQERSWLTAYAGAVSRPRSERAVSGVSPWCPKALMLWLRRWGCLAPKPGHTAIAWWT